MTREPKKIKIPPNLIKRRNNQSAKKWDEFLAFCGAHARANYWFRGVSSTAHKLIPKVGRGHDGIDWYNTVQQGSTRINLSQREQRLFAAFKRRARLGLQFIPETDFEWLAIAQHHGVPTRLLDWTTNPLMAAWFATSSQSGVDEDVARVYRVAVSPSDLANEHTDPFNKRFKNPQFVVAPHWHPRVRAQRGCFSIHPVPNEEFQPENLVHIDIERPHWAEFQKRLYYFGVDASTVMADLSGLGAALSWQYQAQVGIGQVGY